MQNALSLHFSKGLRWGFAPIHPEVMRSMFHCDVSRWGVWLMIGPPLYWSPGAVKGKEIMWNALKQHMECMSLWSASQLNDIHGSGGSRTHDVATLLIHGVVRRCKLIFGTPMGPIRIIQNIGLDFYCFILQWHKADDAPRGREKKKRNSHTRTQGHPVLFFYSGTHLALFFPNQPFCKWQQRRRLWGERLLPVCQSGS